MKDISAEISKLSQDDIIRFESKGDFELRIGNEILQIDLNDVEIISEDIPGWLVANDGKITVALDITLSEDLRYEGIAREFVNRIQNLRKDSGFDVTDKIKIEILKHEAINEAIIRHSEYIGAQTLAVNIDLVETLNSDAKEIEIDEDIKTSMKITRLS
jgi:isoleucyl-tRNA synthetase